MTSYRVYLLNDANHISGVEIVDALDGTAVVEQAKLHHPNTRCEIWEHDRKVALITAPSVIRSRLGQGPWTRVSR